MGKRYVLFLTVLDIKSGLRPTTAEVVKGRRPAVDAGGRARCRNTPVAGIGSPPQIAPAVRWHSFHIQLCHRFRVELARLCAHGQHFHDDGRFNVMPGTSKFLFYVRILSAICMYKMTSQMKCSIVINFARWRKFNKNLSLYVNLNPVEYGITYHLRCFSLDKVQ